MSINKRMEELGLELPAPGRPMGLYRPLIVVDGFAHFSGHGPLQLDGKLITGRVGDNLTQEGGYSAARQTALAMLSTCQDHFGSLDNIVRIVKTVGMVQCVPEFKEIPAVVNGFSELMRDVFGEENGIGARSAVGMASLPGDMVVEVDAIFQVRM